MGIVTDDHFLGVLMKCFQSNLCSLKGGHVLQKMVIRDYAHAPSKVKASVHAVKERYPKKNLIACLELHT
ncbi:MAG: peptidoglycan synthetase, partial [Bacteroidota bacterium]